MCRSSLIAQGVLKGIGAPRLPAKPHFRRPPRCHQAPLTHRRFRISRHLRLFAQTALQEVPYLNYTFIAALPIFGTSVVSAAQGPPD